MKKELKKPNLIYRLIIHTFLFILLSQFNGDIVAFDGWFFEYYCWDSVAVMNAAYSWPVWLIAYLFCWIFRKSFYPIRLSALSFMFLILSFLFNLVPTTYSEAGLDGYRNQSNIYLKR